MPKVYSFEGITPVVDPTAFVHPTAVLIGDVVIGARCYIGPLASVRGDLGRILIGAGANIQDNCTLHGFAGCDTVVEEDGHIGHGAILHSCRIGRNAMVGMNAVVMDEAVIGASSIVGAHAFVKAAMIVPPRMLVLGSPARIVRALDDGEIEWKARGTARYHDLALRSRTTMRLVDALEQEEPDRMRLPAGGCSVPKHRDA